MRMRQTDYTYSISSNIVYWSVIGRLRSNALLISYGRLLLLVVMVMVWMRETD